MVSTGVVASSLVGSLLGKDYRVLEQIGRGGMAVVYLVEHQTLQKKFAAKVLSPEHASNEEARARFTQEAHAASHLDHENIVTISDFGTTADERPFYVMELLRGQTLMERLEAGPMTLEEVVAVIVPVARALAHAHREGVVHRDVKPENVFLVQRSQGRWGVKVLDFGIAKVTTNPALTKMGQALGSPMFMAPEACRGDDVDARADLYSFGIVLYLMLTGRVPFMDENLLKVLQMQVSSPVPPLREIKPEISEELEAVVMRSLQKKPDDRYPTMDAMLLELQVVLPEGSDLLLQQAQFGTSLHDTPFPGQSLRMIALSSQRLMIGDKDASTQLEPSASAKFPVAPERKRRGALILLALLIPLLAVAGVIVAWQMGVFGSSSKSDGPAVAVAPPSPADPAPAPIPTTPRKVGPAAPSVEPDPKPVEPDPKPEPEPEVTKPEPVVAKAQPPIGAKPPITPVVVPKRVITPPVQPKTVPAPKKAGSNGSNDQVAVVPTPPTKEPPRVDPPTPPTGSQTPPPTITPPVKQPDAPVVAVGSLDANPTITGLDVNGPLPSSVVRRSVERALPALRACYRTAAKARNATPAATISLSFEVDEHSAFTRVAASGAKDLSSLAGCARGAISRLQTQQAPDVGTVNVVVTIQFKPI